jgi:hypothetical protein
MQTFWTVTGWAVLASVVAWAVGFAGIFAYFAIAEPTDASDIRAWQTFGAGMGSLAFAGVGLVVGAIFGIVRVRRAGSGRE